MPATARPSPRARVAALAGSLLLTPAVAAAQAAPAAVATPRAADSAATAHEGAAPRHDALVRGRDLVGLGAFAAAALAVAPADERIARWSQRPGAHASRAVDRTASFVRTLGGPGTVAIPVLTYGVGLIAHDRGVAAVGLHTGEAVVAAEVVTSILKVAAGRARPYVSHDSDAGNWAFGRGLRRGDAYQAFPSGHATASFALAAALAGEGRARWPRVNRVTGPLGFGVATLVAASRVYHDAHWASDVVAGAGVGTVVGSLASRYARGHPGATIERRLLPSAAAVGGKPVTAIGFRFGM